MISGLYCIVNMSGVPEGQYPEAKNVGSPW